MITEVTEQSDFNAWRHTYPVAPIPGGQGGQRTTHFFGQGVKPRLTIRQR
jgi:hypothetical protein